MTVFMVVIFLASNRIGMDPFIELAADNCRYGLSFHIVYFDSYRFLFSRSGVVALP